MVKRCFKCKRTKPIDQFYAHKAMSDGHLNKCKCCAKKDVTARYYSPKHRAKIIEYEKTRFKNPERKAKLKIYQQNRRARSKGKYRAHTAVGNAIRDGRLIRQPCEVCTNPKSQAHHDDYRKKLTVRWLCFKHHREHHQQSVTPF